MTTEEKALALVNAVLVERQREPLPYFTRDRSAYEALCRAIEAHEADKKAFSDAVKKAIEGCGHNGFMAGYIQAQFAPFILPEPEPDPLVEIAREMTLLDGVVRTDNQKAAIREGRAGNTASDDFYDRLRTALAARGYKIERIDND
jgi:hypothetical protein